MDPSNFVLKVQLLVALWCEGFVSWHTLAPLVPIDHCLKFTALQSIVARPSL